MKSFKRFLVENAELNPNAELFLGIDESLGPDETIVHVNNYGEVVVETSDAEGESSEEFDMFFSDEDGE